MPSKDDKSKVPAVAEPKQPSPSSSWAAGAPAAPPHGEVWTGHSLRKGAASASDAAGVTLARICHVGGWSIKSSAVKDYIDPTCPDSAAGRRYFGWLLPL